MINKICETCDTRNRLCMCNGIEGDFKYCFRKVGSVYDLQETITPFNNLDELFLNTCEYIRDLDRESLYLSDEYYGNSKHMRLLFGRFLGDSGDSYDKGYPVGFVIC